MSPPSPTGVSPATSRPFSGALELTGDGCGGYRAELGSSWSVRGGKLHGGFLLALLARTGLVELDARRAAAGPAAASGGLEPLAVSAEYLRAPETGAVELGTEVVKVGATASVVRVTASQRGRATLSGTVTAGRLPDAPVDWADLGEAVEQPAEPLPGMVPTSRSHPDAPPLARACDLVLDPTAAVFLNGERGDPVMRGWVRPVGEPPDPLFAVLAGDLLPPLLVNLGRSGWPPTVQMTALLRGRPEPGWLRVRADCRTLRGTWFDSDATVVDSAGRLICQARQLALTPLARAPKTR